MVVIGLMMGTLCSGRDYSFVLNKNHMQFFSFIYFLLDNLQDFHKDIGIFCVTKVITVLEMHFPVASPTCRSKIYSCVLWVVFFLSFFLSDFFITQIPHGSHMFILSCIFYCENCENLSRLKWDKSLVFVAEGTSTTALFLRRSKVLLNVNHFLNEVSFTIMDNFFHSFTALWWKHYTYPVYL